MTAAIELDALTKTYGELVAVDRISFTVPEGQIFGFMGHNGAGKTTTIRMLLGLTRPSGGAARVLGRDVVADSLAVRGLCGFLPASYGLPRDMSALDFLAYVGAMFGLPRAEATARGRALLELFDLGPVAGKALGGFSTGMAQKVGLAQALIGRPRVLFLDEPTSGLDPLGRHHFLTHIRDLARDQGVTVLFSTHILGDVESICEQVAVMHHGRLLACGALQALKAERRAATMDDLYLDLVQGAA
jgi:ABC-2 type transport system ATP-binding protein